MSSWQNDHYRHILLFTFNQGCKAAKIVADIFAVYGDDPITERTSQKLFSKFRIERFALTQGAHRSPCAGWWRTFEHLIKEGPQQTSRKLVKQMYFRHLTVADHLHLIEKVQQVFWTKINDLLALHRLTYGCILI